MSPTRHDRIDRDTTRTHGSSGVADFDALADMFLNDRAAPKRPAPARNGAPTLMAAQPAPSVELIVPGHLPVLSGAWVVQLASKIARDAGQPVVLAQLGRERTAVQILWARAPEFRPRASHDLGDAVAEAAQVRARWLIATDEGTAAGLLCDPRLSGACLLTAGNETAIVAAYQTLRTMWRELDTRQEPGADTPPVRLAVAGASADDARRVCERIARAAGVFASQKIELATAIERIGPTIATPIFESDRATDAATLLDLIGRSAQDDHARAPVSPRHEPELPPAALRDSFDFDAPIPLHVPLPQQRVDTPPVDDRPPAPAARPSLATLIEDSAPAPTPIRCPDAPRVEVGVDADGTLHIMVDADESAIDTALLELCVTRAWLDRQGSLVRMALGRAADAPLTIRDHLFVRSARSARTLLDTPVCVRLLKPVSVRGQRVWITEPLN